MGKGNRNRQRHLEDKLANPEKYSVKEKKKAPKWLTPAISIVLVAAILIGVVASIITGAGIIPRNRILVESQTGKFDLNQQMITFIIWQEVYYSAYSEYYSYYYSGTTSNITSLFSSAGEYALTAAQYSVTSQLRDFADSYLDLFKVYVAICDEAHRAGVTLEAKEKKEIDDTIKQLKSMQTSYGYVSFDVFLKNMIAKGMKEKDVRAALEVIALYNKYAAMQQEAFEDAVTEADIDKYLKENPDGFYKIDYLTYAADDKEFADELKACTTAEQFKALVLEKHLEENYKTSFNKFVTTAKANEDLASLSTKIGEALSKSLDTIGADGVKEFTKDDDFEGKTSLKTWLFNTSRKQYETTVVAVDDGIYLVAFYSTAANTSKVQARVKYYEFLDGDAYEGDDNFKATILEHLRAMKEELEDDEEPTLPVVDYKKATDKATALKDALTADGANIAQILKDNGAVDKTDVTTVSGVSVLPKAVRDAATKSTVKKGDVLTTNDGATYYVIYVSDIDATTKAVDLSYVTFEDDLYYKVINDLTASLDKVYPTKLTGSYNSKAEKDTFAAWISELADKDAFTSARKEFETKVFDTTKDNVTTYNVYMILNTPLYLQTEEVVVGGYLQFDDDEFAQDAEDALKTIKENTELDLMDALSAFNGSATVSNAIKLSTVESTDKKLAEWLFSADRTKNEIAVVTAEDKESAFVAVFVEKTLRWRAETKAALVSDQMTDWADSLAEKYTVNEKVLKKLGDPTPTTESSTESGTESSTESTSEEETTTAA